MTTTTQPKSILHDGCFAPAVLRMKYQRPNDLEVLCSGALSEQASSVSCVEEFTGFFRVWYRLGRGHEDIERQAFLGMVHKEQS